MQLHKGAQGKHAAAVGVTAVQNNSAAACLATGVNRLLKCSGVVGCSISQGTEIYYMIVHNLLHSADFSCLRCIIIVKLQVVYCTLGFYFKGMVLCLFPEGTGGNPVDAPEAVLEIVTAVKTAV